MNLVPYRVLAEGGARVEAEVLSMEALGHEAHVSLRLRDGPDVLARLPAAWSAPPGATVEVGLDLKRLHAFAEDGVALGPPRS